MAITLKDGSNVELYRFPDGFHLDRYRLSKRTKSVAKAYQHGGDIVGDERHDLQHISLVGTLGAASIASFETACTLMKENIVKSNLRLYGAYKTDQYFAIKALESADWDFLTDGGLADVSVRFLADPFRYYQDETISSHFVDTALSLNGSGYASIADASQKGLDMGYSDFMLEIWFKTSITGANQAFICKRAPAAPGFIFRTTTSDELEIRLYDGVGSFLRNGSTATSDNKWHYAVLVADRSGNAQLFLDGIIEGDALNIGTLGSISGGASLEIGSYLAGQLFTGQLDEFRIWNFGKDGLPADYAAYITWRYANPHAALSEYDSDAWAGYADADRTEKVTDPGIEAWTGDTPDDWSESGESGGVRDITDEQVEIHGGSHAVKLESTNDDGSAYGLWQDVTLVANKYYEIFRWVRYSTRTAGTMWGAIQNATDGYMVAWSLTSTNAAYAFEGGVFKPTVVVSRVYMRMLNGTTTEIGYYDDISIKRVGLVAHWKFDGDYTDETSNSNDLTAGGSGNSFDEYIYPATVSNGGDMEVSPVITLTAGVGASFSKIKIENSTDSDKYFEYEPVAGLTSGDVVEIDCRSTTVKRNTVDNIVYFSGAFIELQSGDNSIIATVTGTVGTNQLEFKFRKRYL